MPVTKEEVEAYFATEEGKTHRDELGAPLKATNAQLKDEKTALKTKHDLLVIEHDTLKAKPPEKITVKVTDDAGTKKLIDDAVLEVTTASKAKVGDLELTIANMQRTAIGGTLKSEITKAIQAEKGNVLLLERIVASRVKAELGEDGIVVLTPLKADGKSAMYNADGVAGIDAIVKELKANKDFATAFNVKVPTGSGSGHQDDAGAGADGYDLAKGTGNLGAFLVKP